MGSPAPSVASGDVEATDTPRQPDNAPAQPDPDPQPTVIPSAPEREQPEQPAQPRPAEPGEPIPRS